MPKIEEKEPITCIQRDDNKFKLYMMYQNVRGLNTKVAQFYENAISATYDLILLTETWLDDSVGSYELFGVNYNVYRSLKGRKGRGVLIAVNNKYTAESVCLSSPFEDIDILVINVFCCATPLTVINIYIPPASSIQMYESVLEYLEEYQVQDITLIVGDFNVPEFYACITKAKNSSSRYQILNNFMNFNQLKQHNYVTNNNNRILDLVMSTEKITCNINRLVNPLVDEDLHHPSLLVKLTINSKQRKNFETQMDIVRYNFRKADFPGLYGALMKMEWSDILEIHDVNDICAYFYDKIYEMFEIYVPKTKVVTTHFPLWYSSNTIKMIKKKDRIWKSYKISHILSCKEAARKLEEQIKIEIKKDFRNFQRSAEANMKSDPARF